MKGFVFLAIFLCGLAIVIWLFFAFSAGRHAMERRMPQQSPIIKSQSSSGQSD